LKTKIAGYNVVISEILDIPTLDGHPFLTVASFILADDKPNINNQAISEAEFQGIIDSAVGMPIKMKFTGEDVDNHAGSIPIGHIRSIQKITADDGTNQLVAEALLWKEEFPEEIYFLKEAYAEGKAPGISYEMGYKDSETIGGIQWLKKVVTMAATFVKNPAYGTRTHLLALASLSEEERNTQILALAKHIEETTEPITDKGGNLVNEELETQLRAEAASKQTEIEELLAKLAESDTTITQLQSKVADMELASVIDNRTRQYADAGFALEADAEKADKKKALIASFNDDQWTEYLADLVAAKATAAPAAPAPSTDPAVLAIAEASARNAIPRLSLDDEQVNLKDAMRALARPYSE